MVPRKLRRWTQYAMSRLTTSCPLCGMAAKGGHCCKPCADDLWFESGRLGCCDLCLASIPGGHARCAACHENPASFRATVAGIAYDFPGDMLIQEFKEAGRLDYGPALAGLMARSMRAALHPADWPEMLIPVPASSTSLRRRGFNPAAELCMQLSRHLDIPVRQQWLVCRGEHAPQKTLDLHQRRASVRGRYQCDENLPSVRVGLVDDVMTTGSTVREIAEVLQRQGAQSITVLVAARTPMVAADLAKSRHV